MLVLLASLGGSIPVWSQRTLPDAAGTWKPWKPLSTTTGSGGAKEQVATPALVKAFEGELWRSTPSSAAHLASRLRWDSASKPGDIAGYNVAEHAPGQPAAGKLPIAGGFTFGAFPIFEYQRNGKTIREDTGETALQQFLINQIDGGLFDRGRVSDWGPIDTDALQKPMPKGRLRACRATATA